MSSSPQPPGQPDPDLATPGPAAPMASAATTATAAVTAEAAEAASGDPDAAANPAAEPSESSSSTAEKAAEVSTEDHDDEETLVIDESADKKESNEDHKDSKEEEEEEEEKDFEPTIDMMINDFDDERTMEEEEALAEEDENATAEAEALEEEAEMPLEELLKKYGYGHGEDKDNNEENTDKKEDAEASKDEPKEVQEKSEASGSEATKQNGSNSGVKRGSMSPPPPAKKSKSELARFYEATVEGRALRSSSGGQNDEEDEDSDGATSGVTPAVTPGGNHDDDEDTEGRDYSWKKTIMIGPSYQASVPSDLCHYDDTLPYENEDKLLWAPDRLSPTQVEEYLIKSQEALQPAGGVATLPLGAHTRDDEQALYLLHQCGNNFDEALRRRRMNAIPSAETMSLWSEEECRAFELGLRLYGKDFHMIQQQKVRTRSVGELVQFYYLWKKTERHDIFANATRLEKKKYTLHPGTTDYMDRFIDEQDPSKDLSSSSTTPNFHSLLFGTEQAKKNSSYSVQQQIPITLGGASHSDSAAAAVAVTSGGELSGEVPVAVGGGGENNSTQGCLTNGAAAAAASAAAAAADSGEGGASLATAAPTTQSSGRGDEA